MPDAASLNDIFDPAQVRLAELGAALLARQAADRPADELADAVLQLQFGLEAAAQQPAGPDRDLVVGQLIEHYGLGAVGFDPFLQAYLPPVPAQGATYRPWVLALHGQALAFGGQALSFGGRLVAATS